jgi:hypothetical protein
MTSESESGGNAEERQGPQGTQVFSRDQLPGHLATAGGDATVTGREARLIGTSESLGGKEFVLVSDRTTIGRSQVCDIQIDEPSLSSEHARLVRSEDGWRVINLLSTNGVFVNDEKVFSHRLNDGDVIRLGRISLKFRDPNSKAGDSGSSSRFSTGMAIGFVAALIGAAAWFFLLR